MRCWTPRRTSYAAPDATSACAETVVCAVMPPGLDNIRVARAPAAHNPGNQEGNHGEIHDTADREEDREQDQELTVVRSRIAKRALVMLIAAGAGEQRDGCSRSALHWLAVSALRVFSRGVRVAGVVPLISSPRLDTTSLLG